VYLYTCTHCLLLFVQKHAPSEVLVDEINKYSDVAFLCGDVAFKLHSLHTMGRWFRKGSVYLTVLLAGNATRYDHKDDVSTS
jgi:hypothetical protein